MNMISHPLINRTIKCEPNSYLELTHVFDILVNFCTLLLFLSKLRQIGFQDKSELFEINSLSGKKGGGGIRVFLFTSLSFCSTVCLSIGLTVFLSVCLSFFLRTIPLSVRISVCPSVYVDSWIKTVNYGHDQWFVDPSPLSNIYALIKQL